MSDNRCFVAKGLFHDSASTIGMCLVALWWVAGRVVLRGTSVRGLASRDERNVRHRFLLRSTEQISAEWERVYIDLSLSCMAPEGRVAISPHVVGNHAKMLLASLWLCFPMYPHRLLVSSFVRVRIRFVFVVV